MLLNRYLSIYNIFFMMIKYCDVHAVGQQSQQKKDVA
jgi:hypothetical protein